MAKWKRVKKENIEKTLRLTACRNFIAEASVLKKMPSQIDGVLMVWVPDRCLFATSNKMWLQKICTQKTETFFFLLVKYYAKRKSDLTWAKQILDLMKDFFSNFSSLCASSLWWLEFCGRSWRQWERNGLSTIELAFWKVAE